MTEKYSEADIIRLRKEIEQALGWGTADTWHSKMFEELSEKIFEATQVRLSITTLKRFFGVISYQGSPSITTLDSLTQFVGYDNWRSFKLSKKTGRKRKIKGPSRSVYIAVGFVLALIVISFLGNRRPDVIINASEFSFSSKVLSREYPNSVVFDFEVPASLSVDSFTIQQTWDPTKTISIKKGQQQATGIYYFPGYFKARLLVDGQEVQRHDLFLKSNGWLGLVEYEPVPKYFIPLQKPPAQLSVPVEIKEEVIPSEKPIVSSFHYIDDLGNISGDNLSLTATVQYEYDDRWAVCQSTRIYLIGTDGVMIIPFSKLGCSSEDNLLLNDVYLSGKEHDLSAFSTDFTEPTKLGIEIRNKEVSVLINDTQVYNKHYSDTMGDFVGLRFKFHGLGKVLDFQIKDQHNQIIHL